MPNVANDLRKQERIKIGTDLGKILHILRLCSEAANTRRSWMCGDVIVQSVLSRSEIYSKVNALRTPVA